MVGTRIGMAWTDWVNNDEKWSITDEARTRVAATCAKTNIVPAKVRITIT